MIKINKLNAFYGKVQVLHDISINIEEGKIITILGANGAGKSTLMRAISGTLDKSDGSIKYLDKEISKMNYTQIVKLGVCHVPEGREVFPQLSVEDNLLMGAYLRKDRNGIKEDMKWVFDHFPVLKERLSQLAGTLSGGQQQMLAIGRGIMSNPKILILDEPSLGLAPIIVSEIFENIVEINKVRGITILLVEQNVKRALNISDYGYVMENGKLVFEGTNDEISNNDQIVNLYLGGKGK